MLNRNSAVRANATAGRGGNVRIDADRLVVSVDSAITASAETGISGTVVTTSPEVDLTSGLQVLPETFLNVDNLLQETCAGRGEDVSSFTGTGRGGLPPDPASTLSGSLVRGAAADAEPDSQITRLVLASGCQGLNR